MDLATYTLPELFYERQAEQGSDYSVLGIWASVMAGIVCAFYNVIAQKCLERFHPVPFTWISFALTLLLSGVSLLFFSPPITQLDWTPMWIGSIFSGLMSFIGHILNNLGIRMIGANTASIVGSSSPALTALVAWVTIARNFKRDSECGDWCCHIGDRVAEWRKVD